MKRVWFSGIAAAMVLTVTMVLLCSCKQVNTKITPADPIDPPDNIYVGMSKADFVELYPEEVCFYYWASYAFFDDPDGNPVVVYFDCGTQYSKATVGAVYAYDKNGINPTDEVFCALEGGMLVQEIVSYVGNPYPLTNPTETMVWIIGENTEYRLQLGYLNGHVDDELYLCLMHRWEGDVHSYPIGSEPWYLSE